MDKERDRVRRLVGGFVEELELQKEEGCKGMKVWRGGEKVDK